jgi:hypothetical protein
VIVPYRQFLNQCGLHSLTAIQPQPCNIITDKRRQQQTNSNRTSETEELAQAGALRLLLGRGTLASSESLDKTSTLLEDTDDALACLGRTLHVLDRAYAVGGNRALYLNS